MQLISRLSANTIRLFMVIIIPGSGWPKGRDQTADWQFGMSTFYEEFITFLIEPKAIKFLLL